MTTPLVGVVVLWVAPTLVAHAIGRSKRRRGAAYGIALGWPGVLLLALLPAAEAWTPEDVERDRTLIERTDNYATARDFP